MSGQLHVSATLPPGKSVQYPLDRRLVDPGAGVVDVEKRKFLTLQGLEIRPLGRLACRQSLYRLRYPAPNKRGVKRNSIKRGNTALENMRKFEYLGTIVTKRKYIAINFKK
jgi:hypothetical protein